MFTALSCPAPWSACHRPHYTMSSQRTSRLASSLARQQTEQAYLLNHHGGSVPCVNVSKWPSFSFIYDPLIDRQPIQIHSKSSPAGYLFLRRQRAQSATMESFWYAERWSAPGSPNKASVAPMSTPSGFKCGSQEIRRVIPSCRGCGIATSRY